LNGCSGVMAIDGAMVGLRPGKGGETDPTEEKPHARMRWAIGLDMRLLAAALRSKQALAFKKLPGNGAGPDCSVQVLGVTDPGDAVRIHAHAGALHSAQVGIGDGGLLAHVVQVCAGPIDRLPCMVVQVCSSVDSSSMGWSVPRSQEPEKNPGYGPKSTSRTSAHPKPGLGERSRVGFWAWRARC
jgi:hypothetical protein